MPVSRSRGCRERSLPESTSPQPWPCGRPGPTADAGCPLSAVKEKLRLDPDSEIATTGVRVSLICPVSRGVRPHPPVAAGAAV